MKILTEKQHVKSSGGFTLIEVIITMILVSIVLATLYAILSTGLSSYRVTSERVDAQSQFRLVVGILEKEVGTATNVELLEDVPASVPAGYACIYVKKDGDMGTFYRKTEDGEKEYNTPYPLKNLSMVFKRGTSQNVLDVYLHANNSNDYFGSILAQNAVLVNSTPGIEYSVVFYEILDM